MQRTPPMPSQPAEDGYGDPAEWTGVALPAEESRPVPLPRFVRVVLFSGLAIGLYISGFIHLSGLLMSQHIWFGAGGTGSGTGRDQPVGLAVVTEQELSEIQGAELQINTPSVGLPPVSDLGGQALDLSAPSAIGAVPGEGQGDLGVVQSNAADIGGGVGSGLGIGAGAGGGGASFFGVEAAGNRFAFMVDVSGSMSVGGKIERLRAELSRSVDALLQNSHFAVIPFSSGQTQPLGGRAGWLDATDRGKRAAVRAIETLNADGGTEPSPAFQLVFSFRPRPDAIYFMTDGEFSPEVALEVAAMNAQARIPVHCLCFVSEESAELMRKIARESGGSYTFVPGPR